VQISIWGKKTQEERMKQVFIQRPMGKTLWGKGGGGNNVTKKGGRIQLILFLGERGY